MPYNCSQVLLNKILFHVLKDKLTREYLLKTISHFHSSVYTLQTCNHENRGTDA